MSIYTLVERPQLELYLTQYRLGKLLRFEGIEAGVENTNYFVTTSKGEYVLTLVESVPADKMPFILGFVARLSASGIAVAQPVRNRYDELFGTLNDRPAVFMKRLKGAPLARPSAEQCAVIGRTLAHCHQAAARLPAEEYQHISQWCNEVSAQVMPQLEEVVKHQLQEAVFAAGTLPWSNLPQGPIHADLFPDNALFDGNVLTGLIDFYHACSAPYLYDLAVTLNAWCYDEGNDHYDREKEAALLDSYNAVRRLTAEEQRYLKPMQKVAALRFWLSRLRDCLFARTGQIISVKDPNGKQALLNRLGRD